MYAQAIGPLEREAEMPKIFISYRREDSQDATGRLYDKLSDHFGESNVFYDVDSIPLGVNYRTYLEQEVSKCDLLLAVIGRDWLSMVDEKSGQRRLDQKRDFVRIEIESAFKHGIPVIPILVRSAPMPDADALPQSIAELAEQQGTALSGAKGYNEQVATLCKDLEYAHTLRPSQKSGETEARMTSGQGLTHHQTGMRYVKGDGVPQSYDKAAHYFGLGAEEGEPKAQYNLGFCYAEGKGVEQSHQEAVHWYRLAAKQGMTNAQVNLGFCYEKGKGVQRSHDQAVYWYQLAAKKGDEDALSALERLT